MTSYLQKRNLISVDIIRPHAWISTPNKEKLSRILLHIVVLTHKSDGMKQIYLGFSESELFENFPLGLALRGHDLPLTSGQEYQKLI